MVVNNGDVSWYEYNPEKTQTKSKQKVTTWRSWNKKNPEVGLLHVQGGAPSRSLQMGLHTLL